MRPEALRLAREWIDRAEVDLHLADRALRVPPAIASGAAYHAQQAGEKALKAFLTAHDQAFSYTHDLSQLVPACEALEPGFARFAADAQSLTPYATQFRYPGSGGPLEPALADAEQAVQAADGILRFVRRQLGI